MIHSKQKTALLKKLLKFIPWKKEAMSRLKICAQRKKRSELKAKQLMAFIRRVKLIVNQHIKEDFSEVKSYCNTIKLTMQQEKMLRTNQLKVILKKLILEKSKTSKLIALKRWNDMTVQEKLHKINRASMKEGISKITQIIKLRLIGKPNGLQFFFNFFDFLVVE